MSRPRYDICAAVIGDLSTDARVWREVRSLAAAGYRVALIGCRYEIAATQHRSQDGIDVTEVPLGSRAGKVSQLGRAQTLLRVWKEVLNTPARAYHIHNIHPGPAGVLAARLRHAPFVYDAHELYGNAEPRTAKTLLAAAPIRVLEGFLIRRSAAAITTNASRAAELGKRHGRGDVGLLANVPNRVDHVEPLDPGFPSGARVLLYQGGIYARERPFHETIQALKLLPDDVHLVVLGFGREESRQLITRWAAEASVSERVHLLGPRPFDELVRTAAQATIGLVPIKPNHKSDLLGDTNKLHEYLMAGLPVVASDLPEIRRVATAGDPPVGEIFDYTSPSSIADAVRRVLGDGRYDQRRREARRLALEQHNWQVQEKVLTEIYAQLLGRS